MNKTNRKAPAGVQEKISYLLEPCLKTYPVECMADEYSDELLHSYEEDDFDHAHTIFYMALNILTSDWMVESAVARAIKNWENGDE